MSLQNNSPLELIRDLLGDINSDWEDRLREINAFLEFEPIYKLPYKESEKNKIVAFIILAYDYQSAQIDVRRERSEDKARILKNIGLDSSSELFKSIVTGEEDIINECGFNYCMSRKNWKFRSALQLIEQSEEGMKYARSRTDEYLIEEEATKEGQILQLKKYLDQGEVAKVKLQKMSVQEKALENRRKADNLIEEIKKEYAPIEKAIEDEYDFAITNSENFDVECWADYVRKRNFNREKQIKLNF